MRCTGITARLLAGRKLENIDTNIRERKGDSRLTWKF